MQKPLFFLSIFDQRCVNALKIHLDWINIKLRRGSVRFLIYLEADRFSLSRMFWRGLQEGKRQASSIVRKRVYGFVTQNNFIEHKK